MDLLNVDSKVRDGFDDLTIGVQNGNYKTQSRNRESELYEMGMMALLKKNIFQLNISPLCSVKITGGPMQLEFQTHVNLSFLSSYTSSRISKKY